jgi:probable rRNA maturation factor
MIDDSSNLDILIDIDDERWLEWYTPDQWHNLLHKIVQQVIDNCKIQPKVEVSVLLTNNDEVHTLNLEYRGKNKPTNVLSFPNLSEDELRALPKNSPYPIMLGDLVLAFETLLEESAFEKKPFLDHFNHLIVHGMLHLLGYDHESDDDAECMKEKEIKILQTLDINNPYQ